MKKIFAAVFLAAIIAVMPLSAVSALDIKTDSFNSDNGIKISYMSNNGGSAQKLFYAELSDYTKYEASVHTIRNADGTYKLSTVMDIAEDYEKTYGKKVLCAVNGDFFYSSGSPVDTLVMDGSVYSQGNFTYKHCFGFDNKGNAVLGRLTETTYAVRVGGKEFAVDKINKIPTEGEVSLYTSATKLAINNSGKYIFNCSSGSTTNYPLEGKSNRMTVGDVTDNNAFSVSGGRFAIVSCGDNEVSRYLYDNVKYGVNVEVVKIPAGDFAGMQYVVGGYDTLVTNGNLLSEYHTDNSGDVAAPRTILGIKQDGTLFVCIIDGRQAGYSVGLTVTAEAALAKQLGAVNALELDGGGSSTFIARENNTLVLKDKPSDGEMRKVAEAILFVEKTSESESDSESVSEGSAASETEGSVSNSIAESKITDSDSSKTGCAGNISAAVLIILSAVFIFFRKK